LYRRSFHEVGDNPGRMDTLSLAALGRATLARQMLLAREKITPERALDRLLAIQAQWPKPPFLALWARIEGFTRKALHTAVLKHSIVRGTGFRGTIFVMSAKDYAVFRATIQASLERSVQSIVGKNVPDKDREAIVDLGRTFFAEPHTFDHLRDHFTALAAKQKQQMVRKRLDEWLGKGVGTLKVHPDGAIELTNLPKATDSLDPLHGLPIGRIDVSATGVRDALARRDFDEAARWLAPGVIDLIRDRGLYARAEDSD